MSINEMIVLTNVIVMICLMIVAVIEIKTDNEQKKTVKQVEAWVRKFIEERGYLSQEIKEAISRKEGKTKKQSNKNKSKKERRKK